MHHPHWILLSLGDFAGIIPQEQSLHELQQVPNVMIDGSTQSPVLDLGVAREVRLSHWSHLPQILGAESVPLHTCPQGRFILAYVKKWGSFLPSTGASSLTLVTN